MSTAPNPENHQPIPPPMFYILMVLVNGEKHGYAIMQEISQRSNANIKMGPGTLYGTIKKLLENGWIIETDVRPDTALDDERRKYYRITDVGEKVARAEANRLAQLVHIAHEKGLLGGAS